MRYILCRLFLILVAGVVILFPGIARAQTTTIVNSDGGFCAFNGDTGGLRVHAAPNSQFQVERCSANGANDRSRQFFFSGELPPSNILFNSMYLRVGNTIVGADNNAGVPGADFFREVSSSGGSILGDGTSTAVYAADVGGLTYTITQTVTYVFPNDFYTVDIEIDVPSANTQQVDFYSWTDLQLDGDDNGQCIEQLTFPRFVGGENTVGNYFAGYRERDVARSWDSFSCGFFADATNNPDQISGPARSLPNTNVTSNIDIGAATHWEVVNTGGTGASPFRAQFDFIFSVREATLTKFFGPVDEDNNDTIAPGETTSLTFKLTNVPGNPAVGPIGFTDTLPEGVTIVGTPNANQCRGTVSTGTDGTRDTVTLTNGQLNGGEASCEITLDVTSTVPGEHTNTAADISNLTFAQNQVTAKLTVDAPLSQPFSCTQDVYLSQGTAAGVDLFELEFSNGATPQPSLSAPIRPAGINAPQALYNAIGFRAQDGFIYGLSEDEELLRIGSNGAVENQGAIAGLAEVPGNFFPAGTVGPDGLLYVTRGGQPNVFVIDVISRSVVRTITRNNFIGADFVVDADAFFAYSVNGAGRILRLSLTNASGVPEGTVDTLPASALPNGTYGSQYLDVDNRMFVSRNSDNMVFEISLAIDPALSTTLPSGTNRPISSAGPGVSRNDGAFCDDEQFPVGGDPTEIEVLAFIDANGNEIFDGADEPYTAGAIELLDVATSTSLGEAQTDGAGRGRIRNLAAGQGRKLQLRGPGGILLSQIDAVEVIDQQRPEILVPIDPSGRIYASDTRDLIEGAFVQLTDSTGSALPEVCLFPTSQQGQLTGSDGFYRFDVVPGADAACPVGETEYRIAVTAPSGFFNPPSAIIPPQPGPFNPTGTITNAIVPNNDRPQGSDPTTYFLDFLLDAGDVDVINNHIPLDPSTGGPAACSTAGLVEYTFGNPTSTGSGIGRQLLYPNIGSFGGVSVDARFTVLDIEVLDTAGNRVADALTTNLLAFGQIGGRAAIQVNGSAGAPTPFTRRRGRVRIELFQSGTTIPVSSDHSLTFGDFDDTRPLGFDILEQLSIDTSQFVDYSFDAGGNLISVQDGTNLTVSGTQNETGSGPQNSVRFFFRSSSSIELDVFVDGIIDSARLFEIDGTANLVFPNENCNPLPTVREQDVSDAPVVGTAPDGVNPINYGNTLHDLVAGLQLGAAVDGDDAPRTNNDASGDLGDDGISAFPSRFIGQPTYTIPAANISATGTGTLHAWIDFDGNGTFAPGEYATAAVTGGNVAADGLRWTGQSNFTTASTFARFRLTTDVLNDDLGTANFDERSLEFASDGEVEDYQVTITAIAQPPFVCTPQLLQSFVATTGAPAQLATLDPIDAEFDLIGNTAHGISYNAIGLNIQDGFLYGMKAATNELVRIGSDGSVAELGPIAGLPVATTGSGSYISGDFNAAGQYVIAEVLLNQPLYTIDVTTLSVVATHNLSGIGGFPANVAADIGYNPVSDTFYTVTLAGTLLEIDIDAGTATTVGPTGIATSAVVGAVYGDSAGRILGSYNDGQGVFQFDLGTGAATFVSPVPPSGINDGGGALCQDAALDFPPIIDLNSIVGDSDRDFGPAAFVEDGFDTGGNAIGSGPVAIADTDADISDVLEADLITFTIVVDLPTILDGNDESLNFAGSEFLLASDAVETVTVNGTDFQIDYNATTGIFTITNDAGAATPMPQDALDELLRGTTYNHASDEPTEGTRNFALSVSDVTFTSTPALTSVTVTGALDQAIVSGTVFLDNGTGTSAIAHDGLIQGDEPLEGNVTVEAVDIITGDVIATAQTAADGTYTLSLPPEQNGAQTSVRIITPGGKTLISNRSALPLAEVDPANGMFVFTPNAGDMFTGLDFGLVEEPRLVEDQSVTILPGGITALTHVFAAETSMDVTFSITDPVESIEDAFTTILFHDIDCNSSIDAGETLVANPIAVSANDQVCLVVRVSSTAGSASGTTLAYDLTAEYTYASTAITDTLTNSDRITVGDGDALMLTKQVCNSTTSTCDIATGTGFGLSNTGGPGDILQYRIIFETTGTDPVNDVSVADRTPAYSSLTATAPSVITEPAGLNCALIDPAAPTSGFEGELAWACTGAMTPGDQGVVGFEIQIAQ